MVKRDGVKMQWVRLLLLSGAHFYVDVFGGMMPALLPKIREVFGLTLARAVALITVLGFVCNGVQMMVGHMRADKTIPLFIPLGLFLGAGLCLMGFLPVGDSGEYWLYLLVVTGGVGIAILHPEGLRGIHSLDKIPTATSTTIFMMAGFAGYAGGAYISSAMVMHWGLRGLVYLMIPVALLVVLIYALGVRLGVDDGKEREQKHISDRGVSFGALMLMAIPAAISTTLVVQLMSTQLTELHFPLDFGGFSIMIFSISGVAGSLIWALWANRVGVLYCCMLSLLLGWPFLVAYQVFVHCGWAVWLLVPAGFFALASYPLMVTMSHYARGGSLGWRMGMIVGGTWGVAGIVFLLMGKVAEYTGVSAVLNYAWLGYPVAGVIAGWKWWQRKK